MIVLTRLFIFLLAFTAAHTIGAQCANWNDSPKKEIAENAHVNYRNFIKGKEHTEMMAMADADFQAAFDNWKIAYEIAPAADGGRPFHYRDGRAFYRVLHAKATDPAERTAHASRLIAFYEEELQCYSKDVESFLHGRKGYDQFYLQGYSMDALLSMEKAIDKGGKDTEYLVLAPMGDLIQYLFTAGQLDQARAREIYQKGIDLAEQHIDPNEPYLAYYESGKANLVASVAKVADKIFDCAYFKAELLPSYEENKEDMEVVRYVLEKLKAQGCEEADADLSRVQATYDRLYAARAAEYEAERRRLNPAYDAKLMVDDGDFNGAIARYQEAIEAETDDAKKAGYYYQIASLQSGKLGQNGSARTNANKAAQLNPSWGKPIMLVGDIYSKMGRSCGDSWEQRLAILAAIDKYQYARSIDPDVADDANKRINNYSSSLPLREEGFQRGVNPGDKVSVGCGIGETVTVRFQ